MSKPKDPATYIPKPEDILNYQRQEAIGNAPNVYDPRGQSVTTFDENGQPTITNSFSPAMQGIFDQTVSYLQGGPQQVQGFQHSGLENLFSGILDRMNERNGGTSQVQLGQSSMNYPSFPVTPQSGPIPPPTEAIGQPIMPDQSPMYGLDSPNNGITPEMISTKPINPQIKQLFGGY